MKIRYFMFLALAQILHAQPLLQDDPATLLASMSLDEKIGQLYMVAAVSDSALNAHFLEYTPYSMDQAYIEQLVTQYHVGGVIFLGSGTIQSQYAMTKHLQSISKIPLLIGQDCEWGLAMRLRDVIKLPYALTLGAIQDTTLIYRLAHLIGTHCAALGVHSNFAPVADVNTNPDNPVIGYRSFGNDPDLVAHQATAFAHGLRDAGILACAKHAPGHGDTHIDSHYTLPIIHHTRDHMKAVELAPFAHLISAGIPAIMMAHVAVPALDKTLTPASLSYPIITQLFREQLHFDGLIVTDGLGMRAVTHRKRPGTVELAALMAGADILLCPVDVPAACTRIKQALIDGTISQQELDAHVLRILQAKHALQVQMAPTVQEAHTIINDPGASILKQQLFDAAVTIVRDAHQTIPLTRTTAITHVQLGTEHPTHFAQLLQEMYDVTPCTAQTDLSMISTDQPLVISIHGMSKYARDNYGISPECIQLIQNLCTRNPRSILVLFGNPYSVSCFADIPCVICGYEDEPEAHQTVAHILSGAQQAIGRLPV